ncbi:malate synthase [Chromatiaceae bacterium AAb-1]|nr:malate synthase [Chromatiaceae bacterium AAb-1]
MTATTMQPYNNSSFEQYIRHEISRVTELNQHHLQQQLDYSKHFLDKVCPLEAGSHQNVCSYVVYYQHLLAFFPDGSISGLQYPAQFVGLQGHKASPSSLLLNSNHRHIELIINPAGTNGMYDSAGIDDIQLQVTETQSGNKTNCWFSMLSGRQLHCYHPGDKQFTGKDGLAYQF